MENKEIEIGNKHKLSRAAVMGLAPFVYLMMKSGDFELDEEEEKFVKGYINFGYVVIGVLILAFVIATTSYFTQNIVLYKFLDFLSMGLTILGIFLIFVGIFMVHSGRILFKSESIQYKKIATGNTNILLSYIPLYNIFLWYQDIDPKNYWWIKESIIFWGSFVLLGTIIQNQILLLILLLAGTIRIISALMGVDIINDVYKEKLDKIFDKNPEEIFGYIKGPIVYLWHKILKKINKTGYMQNDINIYIENSIQEYKQISTRNDKVHLFEYILFFLLNLWTLRGMIYIINLEVLGILVISPYILLIGRYAVALYLDKLSNIPILHEILLLLKKIIKF